MHIHSAARPVPPLPCLPPVETLGEDIAAWVGLVDQLEAAATSTSTQDSTAEQSVTLLVEAMEAGLHALQPDEQLWAREYLWLRDQPNVLLPPAANRAWWRECPYRLCRLNRRRAAFDRTTQGMSDEAGHQLPRVAAPQLGPVLSLSAPAMRIGKQCKHVVSTSLVRHHDLKRKRVGPPLSFTNTGDITLILIAKAAVPDPKAEAGWSIVDPFNLTLKSAAEEKEYTFTPPVNEHTIAPRQLEEWQQNGTKVTVFCSAVRAQPFVHDTTKDKNGNPLKRYARPGKRLGGWTQEPGGGGRGGGHCLLPGL